MPTPRSSRGRSPGSTQTSGLIPMPPASATRSRATAPSDRSITVTSPPVATRADHGEQGGPAGQRAAGDVDPVEPVRERDRIPQRLPGEHLLAGLPAAEPPGVILEPAEQLALLVGTGGPDPALLGGDGGPQVPPAP